MGCPHCPHCRAKNSCKVCGVLTGDSRICVNGHERFRRVHVKIADMTDSFGYICYGSPDWSADLRSKITRDFGPVNPRDIPDDVQHDATIHVRMIRGSLAPLLKGKHAKKKIVRPCDAQQIGVTRKR